MALGIWDGFYTKFAAIGEAGPQEIEDKPLENQLREVRRFWDILVMKLWPENVATEKPAFSQKLNFLKEILPTSRIWKELSLTFHPTQRQIAAVHTAYEKVTDYNVLYPSHKKLIYKCKALGLLK